MHEPPPTPAIASQNAVAEPNSPADRPMTGVRPGSQVLRDDEEEPGPA